MSATLEMRFARCPSTAAYMLRVPAVGDQVLAQWHMAAGSSWRFGGLTGDYNGIHWSRWYARLFGFRQAFHHPQLVLGQCMAHLPAPDPARYALLRRHRRPKLPVDASALHAAADGPLAVHPAQAVLAVFRRKAVAADQQILFVRLLAAAQGPAFRR